MGQVGRLRVGHGSGWVRVSRGRLVRQVGWVGIGFGVRWCGLVGLWLGLGCVELGRLGLAGLRWIGLGGGVRRAG